MKATVRIKRYDPQTDAAPRWAEYEVEAEPSDRVLDVLNTIKWRHDGTLALRASCAHGICGSDAMAINGRHRLACKTLIRDVAPVVTVSPLRGFRVIKDLIVDLGDFFAQYRAVLPYLVNHDQPPTGERLQRPEERDRIEDTSRCILCACCTASCPSYWANRAYIGPAAIVNAHRFVLDTRDQGSHERLDALNERNGVWRCRKIFNCSNACPRYIGIVEAISTIQRVLAMGR